LHGLQIIVSIFSKKFIYKNLTLSVSLQLVKLKIHLYILMYNIYFFNHSSNFLFPLLALQELQQSAIFSGPFIRITLIICSQVALVFNEEFENIIPQ
jgi:hypothetical protein